jgi:glyoxylase-like metal-dependent hydrolase (beta-lactamase superfamily II)
VFNFATKYGAFRIQGEPWIKNLIDILEFEKETSTSHESFTYDRSYYKSIGRVSRVYSGGDVLSFGSETIEITHIPGHSDSMCCFYFPNNSLCYVSDYNVLTEWGPWYGGEDSNIQELVKSAEKIKDIRANHFVTSHDPMLLERKDFFKYLKKFLAIIDQRNDRILQMIADGMDFSEISTCGLFYNKKYLSHPWVQIWEIMMLIKHLEYLKMFQFIPEVYRSGPNGVNEFSYQVDADSISNLNKY